MKFNNFYNREKVIVNKFVHFIMTENCPFLCEHCMRGDRRPNTISEEVIDTFLSQIRMIGGTVFLGGGEPLMQIKKCIYLIKKLYELGNYPDYIVIITNGSVTPCKLEEFADELLGKANINIMISDDYYHEKERLRLNKGTDNILTTLKEYREIFVKHGFNENKIEKCIYKEVYENCENGKGIVGIGRGVNIKGAEPRFRDFDFHKKLFLNYDCVAGKLQVNPNGIICPSFDMSWDERDLYYGQEYNILNKPISKMLKQNKFINLF